MGTCSWTLALYCRPAFKRGKHFRNTTAYAWLGLFLEGSGLSNRKKMYLHSLPSESDRCGLLVHLFLTSLSVPDRIAVLHLYYHLSRSDSDSSSCSEAAMLLGDPISLRINDVLQWIRQLLAPP